MNNYHIKIYTPSDKLTLLETDAVVLFLYEHLEEYGDKRPDIRKAIAYAMKDIASPGGFVLVNYDKEKVIGAVVVNNTGMAGYIPENILVYIAVHKDYRGQGTGKQMMKKAISTCTGGIALHVEPDNPARRLYEKLGFENKYLEMRLDN